MELRAILNKLIAPNNPETPESSCEAASYEELDGMVASFFSDKGYETTLDPQSVLRIVDPQKINWDNLRFLKIIGNQRTDNLEYISNMGFSQGCHLNADGTWLLAVLPVNADPDDYVARCGPSLESLWLRAKTLPRNIGHLPSLKVLWIEYGELSFSMYTNLLRRSRPKRSMIKIRRNLTVLPGLGNLTQLGHLILNGFSSISTLPGLENLTQLTWLSLSGCSGLSSLPGLGNLTQLTGLDLSGCSKLPELPKLENLSQLIVLQLSGCSGLSELPGLGNLTQLIALKLSKCRGLSELPGLGNLTQLTGLNLSECSNLSELPGLGNLTQLTWVDLSGCSGLSALPGLGNLTQLTSIDFSRCSGLSELPGLEKLTLLTELSVEKCHKLTALPGLGNLTLLTELFISECHKLTVLPGLENLTRLTHLSILKCHELAALPELENMPQLFYLRLSGARKLKYLPNGLRHCRELRYLELSDLRLQDLPDWLPDIAEDFTTSSDWHAGRNKAWVKLEHTTVEAIPDMSIFDQPYEMVVQWFEARRNGGVRPLNEIKVVFLGDGEAGKSHTIARLMNDGGDPDFAVFDGQSTPGIVIRNKEYDLGERKATVHYWDFGGQEIMHSMHRIFLTGRTMYVILLNARDDTQDDRAKYWLHNVQSFAHDAPVLLVLNKIDQNENAAVNEVDLRNRHPKLTQVVRMSALNFSRDEFNSAFTDVLLEEIQKTGYLDTQWPISWTKVKEKLEQMPTHYIMGDAYEDICRECQVDRNQKDLLLWFNDLGVSFCCCDEKDYKLKDYVILRPDWITNALYILLFNPLEGARNGRVPHKTIFDILRSAHKNPGLRCTLHDARYTNNEIQYVLGVMRKFNLSLADGDDHEFIPMLCQRNSTVDTRHYQQDADTLEFSMDFDYLPSNLLHRLMVERHHELDMEKVWRTGARFHVPDLGWSAVVVIEDRTLRFFIRHTDSMHRPNTYLSMLKANVDRIVEKINLKPPVCQLTYKLDNGRDSFHYEMLKGMRKLHQTHVYSMAWQRMIPIADILNQSAPDALDEEMKLLDGITRACRSIQDDPIYCLIKNENGAGYVNGAGMEDLRNRRVRDDLSKSFRISDQSQRGSSGSGKSIGELDLLVLDEYGEPWTIIEALRVSDEKKDTWNAHLDKLLNKYNSRGLPRLYLLTYVDAEPTAFAEIWTSYQAHIKKRKALPYTYSEGSFADLNDARSPRYIKTAKCQYTCSGEPITVYHIFARIPTQNG